MDWASEGRGKAQTVDFGGNHVSCEQTSVNILVSVHITQRKRDMILLYELILDTDLPSFLILTNCSINDL